MVVENGNPANQLEDYPQGQTACYFTNTNWKIDQKKYENSTNAIAGMDSMPHTVLTEIYVTEVQLVGVNPYPEFIEGQQQEHYYNYYYGHSPDGISNAHAVESFPYKGVWPGIDIKFYFPSESAGMKLKKGPSLRSGIEYDFIVHPGSDSNLIQLEYLGSEMGLTAKPLKGLKPLRG
ncbi:MAG: hypothetical protein ACI87N_003458 [Flavobacteriales bacterium]